MALTINQGDRVFFQRDPSTGTRDTTLTGTWSGANAITVELGGVRAVATTVETDAGPPSVGTWSATLLAVPAGEHDLIVHDGAKSTTLATVSIGDILLISGQSNAVGVDVVPDVYDANDDGMAPFTPLSWLPNAWASTGLSWEDSAEKSVWPLVQRGLMDAEGIPVALVKMAINSRNIAAWENNSMAGYKLVRDAALLAQGRDFATYDAVPVVRGLLWWQGTRDADEGTSQAAYNASLDNLANSLFTDIGAQWMPAKMQDTIYDETAVHAAVAEAVADNANVVLGPDLSDLVPGDGKHITDPTDLQTVADRWVAAIVAAWY